MCGSSNRSLHSQPAFHPSPAWWIVADEDIRHPPLQINCKKPAQSGFAETARTLVGEPTAEQVLTNKACYLQKVDSCALF